MSTELLTSFAARTSENAELPIACDQSPADVLRGLVSPRELLSTEEETTSWLWLGYVAPGLVTLLTSQWKSGKTTLVSVLLARLLQGGALGGLPVSPGRALVVSEERRADWRRRCRRLGLDDQVEFLCRPFTGKPSTAQWLALVDGLVALRQARALDLVVIDTLASFTPGSTENSAGAMMAYLAPLQRLTACGMSVLLVHHPRKGRTQAGQAARGSGALCAFVDILIEMYGHGRPNDSDRRRRLHAYSRHEETPRQLTIELTEDGKDYRPCENVEDQEDFTEQWQALKMVFEDAVTKLTRLEILENWPEEFDRPNKATVWRWLELAVLRGLVRQDGLGKKSAPYRYWLPEREDLMRPDEGASKEEMQAWNDRLLNEFLQPIRTRNAQAEALPRQQPVRPMEEAGPAKPEVAASAVVPEAAGETEEPPAQVAEEVVPAVALTELPVVGETAPAKVARARGSEDAPGKEKPRDSAAPSSLAAPAVESAAAGCPPFTLAPIMPTKPDPSGVAARLRSRRWPSRGDLAEPGAQAFPSG